MDTRTCACMHALDTQAYGGDWVYMGVHARGMRIYSAMRKDMCVFRTTTDLFEYFFVCCRVTEHETMCHSVHMHQTVILTHACVGASDASTCALTYA